MPNLANPSITRAPFVGLLSWLVPGLGHLFIGDRARGWILLVTITATFWTGVAVGGVTNTIDPTQRRLWFAAQMCSGGNTVLAWALRGAIERRPKPDGPVIATGHWMSTDIGMHYSGIAGLLNLLVILDALGRCDRRFGDPTVPATTGGAA